MTDENAKKEKLIRALLFIFLEGLYAFKNSSINFIFLSISIEISLVYFAESYTIFPIKLYNFHSKVI